MKKLVESIQDRPTVCCSCVILQHPYTVKTATLFIFCFIVISALCSQWQRGQGCGSAVVRLLRLLVRVSPKDRYLSVLSVVFCQVEISASGLSLVQSSPTECGVSESDRKASIMSRPWPITSCSTMGAN